MAKAEHATASASWSNDKISMSFPFGNRPSSWDSRVSIPVSHPTLQGYVVAWCNELAKDLRSSGMNNAQIFCQDRSYRIGFSVHATAEFTVPAAVPTPSELVPMDFAAGLTVVCKASGGINPDLNPIGPLAPAPQARLTSMTMDVLHNPNPLSCPTQVWGVCASAGVGTPNRASQASQLNRCLNFEQILGVVTLALHWCGAVV